MRILFVHPNYRSGGAEIAGTWPPAWVAYLTGPLRRAGFDDITFIDAMTEGLSDDELRAKADDSMKALLDGVEITERELIKVLEKHGVKKLEPMGQKFDPNRHQAMFEMEDVSVPSGTVVQVMQAGYTIGERVLRPALVAVSKGGAKASASAASANDNPTN